MIDRIANLWEGIDAHPEFRVRFVRHAESQINIMPELEIPRHALPPDNGVTYPLTRLGMQQAKALGAAMATETVLAVYSSPRLRCTQTATAIALPHELPIVTVDDLAEIAFIDPDASMGMIEEADVRVTMDRWAAGDLDAYAPNGGESLREVFQRFIPTVQQLIASHAAQPGTVVIVAHGGILLAGLTVLFANISQEFALGHLFDNTAYAIGRIHNNQLICTDWQGTLPADF